MYFVYMVMVTILIRTAQSGSSGGTCSYDAQQERLWCSLRTLNAQNNTASIQSSTRARHITVQCSDVFFYESVLRTNHFGYLPNLQSLSLEYCKIRRIPSLAFSGLSGLQELNIRTHNSEWSAMVMELEADAFTGLNSLRKLNLTKNNLWTVPSSTFCGLNSLTVLNLSTNFLQDVNELGFVQNNNCNPPLEVLDLSHNSLASISPNAFSQLSRLEVLKLDSNSINVLEDKAFGGLQGLKTLSLANNQLVALPPVLFSAHSSVLEELYLQNNSLSVLAPGLFAPLEQLLVLNLSRNDLTNDWVTSSALSPLVRLVALDLSYNKLTKLDQSMLSGLNALQIFNVRNNNLHFVAPNTFLFQHNLHILLMSHNDLENLHPRAVAGLPVLNSLSLDHNRLRSLHRNALRNCSSLQDLALNNNLLQDVPKAIRPLTLLRTLDIGENQIDTIRREAFDGLHNLYGLRLAGNGIQQLQDEVFVGVPTLQVLNLAHNDLHKLNQSVFNPLKDLRMLRLDNNKLEDINGLLQAQSELRWLNVSANNLQWFDYAFIPKNLKWLDIHDNAIEELGNYYSLKDGFNLATLDASHNRIKKLGPLSLPTSLEYLMLNSNNIGLIEPNTFITKLNLSRVELTANRLERLELSSLAIGTTKTGTLPEFFLGNNPFFCDCEMEWLQKINQMAHQKTHPRVMDLDNVMCSLNNNHEIGTRVPIMKVDSAQFLCPYQAHCFALCMCCDFFACDCRMQCPEGCSCFHDSTWSANVIQCSLRSHDDVPPLIPMDATAIYLDGNNFTGTLESQAFIGRKRVTSLYLNASSIGAINNQTFNGLTELQVLHLEDNLIHSLQGYEFGNLTSLKELYLQRNKLAYIYSNTFHSLVSLEVLYLHENLLSLQPVWELANLPMLKVLTLSGNSWSCQCDYLSRYVNFAQQASGLIVDASNIHCQPGNRAQPPRAFLNTANSTCTDAMAITYGHNQPWNQVLPIAVSIIALCVVLAVGSVILFVFRTPLRVWLHSKYGLRVCRSCTKPSNRDKLYDAFVSYSLKDEDFVHHVLMVQLEQGDQEPGHKLCLQHRDLPHNSCIADTFPSVSHLCAKQVLIVSRAYLESEWNRIKYALQDLKKWKPVIILIEELSSLDLAASPEFNLLLKTATVIKWTETGFWNKLRYYLPDAAHLSYRRNINMNNSGSILVPNTPKLTDRLTGGTTGGRHHHSSSSSSSPRPSLHQMQQLYPTTSAVTAFQAEHHTSRPQRGHHQHQQQPHWTYDGGMIPSNNSSTSTRSTVTNGGSPRTLSSTEDSQPPPPAPTACNANVVPNPMDQLTGSSTLGDGLEQWSDRSDSAYSWHDHTYQTINTNTGEPIYHTLEPDNTIPVMLPNGRLVPATLVRNSSGRIVPFVQVPSSASNNVPTTSVTSSAMTMDNNSSSSRPFQVTFPKTIVYKSPSRTSGYLV